MTKQDFDNIDSNEPSYSKSAANANRLLFEAAIAPDDIYGIKAELQANAELMAEIVEYRRLIEEIRGNSQ